MTIQNVFGPASYFAWLHLEWSLAEHCVVGLPQLHLSELLPPPVAQPTRLSVRRVVAARASRRVSVGRIETLQ